MADMQSQNYIRRSATTMTPPSIRDHEQEVAKLIDVTRCIGCKACQVGLHGVEQPARRDRLFRGHPTTTRATWVPAPGR